MTGGRRRGLGVRIAAIVQLARAARGFLENDDDETCAERLREARRTIDALLADLPRSAAEQRRGELAVRLARLAGEPEPAGYIEVLFDGPPGPESGRFVEVEDERQHSIRIGEWVERAKPSGWWALRIPRRIVATSATPVDAVGVRQ